MKMNTKKSNPEIKPILTQTLVLMMKFSKNGWQMQNDRQWN
jgi:hypothetical protein